MTTGYREDLVGEALQVLYEKHGFKREDLFLQTKWVVRQSVFMATIQPSFLPQIHVNRWARYLQATTLRPVEHH